MDTTTRQEEHVLFARLRMDEGAGTRDEAVRRYLPLAYSLANRYRRSGEPIEDLEQVASIGLLKAIDRYEPERGTAFSSFAVPTILGELRRHFRDRTWAMRVPRELQELSLKLERARDDLTASLGRQPTVAELSEHLDVSEEQILAAFELALVQDTVPIEAPWTTTRPPWTGCRAPSTMATSAPRTVRRWRRCSTRCGRKSPRSCCCASATI